MFDPKYMDHKPTNCKFKNLEKLKAHDRPEEPIKFLGKNLFNQKEIIVIGNK